MGSWKRWGIRFCSIFLALAIAALTATIWAETPTPKPDLLKTKAGTTLSHGRWDSSTNKRTLYAPDGTYMPPTQRALRLTKEEQDKLDQKNDEKVKGSGATEDTKVQRTGPATGQYNCYAYAFDRVDKWISVGSPPRNGETKPDWEQRIKKEGSAEISTALSDQGYKTIAEKDAKKGDIVVYRDANGNIRHAGKVVDAAGGKVTKVESKWGTWGLYQHSPDNAKAEADYGKVREYYSGGAGLDDPPAEPATVAVESSAMTFDVGAVFDDGASCIPIDTDLDGFENWVEELAQSDPVSPASTPELVEFPGSCSDGIDNDLDGLIDAADPGCALVGGTTELHVDGGAALATSDNSGSTFPYTPIAGGLAAALFAASASAYYVRRRFLRR